MPSDEPLAFFNDAWIAASQLSVPIHDAGFVMGATVTDLCRTYRQRLFRWPDHLARFRRSCQGARIPLLSSDEELTAIATKLTANNVGNLSPEGDLALVVFATPGPIGFYAGQSGGLGDGRPTLAMHTFPLQFARYRGLFNQGAHLVVPEMRHVPGGGLGPHIKQRSRLHWWIADREAQTRELGAAALLLDAEDYVTETAAANFLIVKSEIVLSPPRSGILPGISLQVVQELCGELGIVFEERRLRVDECQSADEALLTSTPYGVAGVSRLNGKAIPWPGPILKKFQTAWSAKVGMDIVAQLNQ